MKINYKTYNWILYLIIFQFFLAENLYGQYCTPTNIGTFNTNYISNVNIGSINNSTSSSTGGYTYFSSISATDITAGETIEGTVTVTLNGWNRNENTLIVWMNFNNTDDDFEDDGETFFFTAQDKSNNSGNKTIDIPISIPVPSSALAGVSMMRIGFRTGKNTNFTSCDYKYQAGEIEDYNINIISDNSGASAETQFTYCTPNNINSNNTVNISKVDLAGINNTSSEPTGSYSYNASLPNGEVNIGETVQGTITIEIDGWNTNTNTVAVWMNFNEGTDDDFDDSGERFLFQARDKSNIKGTKTVDVPIEIPVPEDVDSGASLIRVGVRSGDDTNFTSCDFSYTAGEVEDYNISFVSSSNLSSSSASSLDSDGDGVLDSVDIDDDNDGILDTFECSAAIQFNNASLLTATDLNDVQAGEKVVYSNALLYQNQYYDIVLTVVSKPSSVTIDCDGGMRASNGFDSSKDEYVTYSFDLVEAGSATPTNTIGIPATLYDIILELRDIDTRSGRDFTEIVGFNPSTVTSTVTGYLGATSNLEQDGFINGPDPAGYTLYRLDPTISAPNNDWVNDPDDPNPHGDDPDYYMYMEFDQFSHVDLLYGATGSENSTGSRRSYFGVSSKCNADGDTYLDTVDIDADNDGIPDNVEAQPTIGYIPPSNATGGSITDANGNGLDDVYESAQGGTDLNQPEDTDGDGLKDYLDEDSDNDGQKDIQENGMADTFTAADVDNDGLNNAFETNGVMDAFLDVNEDIEDPTDLSILPDVDGDLFTGGDLDYRDLFDVNPPIIASIDFDGVDDYLSRASFIDGLNHVTIMAWVKSDSGNVTNMTLVGEDIGCKLWLQNGNTPSFTVKTSGNSQETINCSAINFDEWHHLAATYTSTTGLLQLFVDGVLLNSTNVGSTGAAIENTKDSNGNFEVGRFSSDVSNKEYFKGDIDEVRVFDVVLTEEQIKKMVYQEIENNSGNTSGSIVRKNIEDTATSNTVLWTNLIAYYPMTNIKKGTTTDYSSYDKGLYINYITTIQNQTAPMPYVASNNGTWTTQSTWQHGDVWDIENTANNKDWSIVKIGSDVSACHAIKTIGLIIDAGSALTVHSEKVVENSWYLELNGTLDLEDDCQLIQTINSDLVTSATGKILRRQEGTSNKYRYNYWSSPVGATGVTSLTDNNTSTNNTNNTPFSLNMLKDEAGINFSFTSAYDEVGKISSYWLYTFISGLTYWDWALLSPSAPLEPGLGYTQKGTGNAGIEQQYIFEGKPNNGTILISVTDKGGSGSVASVSKTEYLLGNPYPSVLDIHTFIDDNAGVINGTLKLWQQWSGDSHYLDEYKAGYAQVNKLGSVRAYQFVGIEGAHNGSQDGTITPSKYLPVGQGFVTEVIADGNVEFNNNQRIFIKESDADGTYNNGTSFFKSSNTKSKESASAKVSDDDYESNAMQKIRLEFNSVTGPETRRELLLGFSETTTDGFDYGYDAECDESNNNDFNLSLEGKNMNMQAYSPITIDKVIPLNFKSSGDNSFEIKITETENLDENEEVYLRDNLTGDYFELTTGEAYSFNSEQGKFNNRFEIVFQSEAETLSTEEATTIENYIYYQNKTNTLFAKKLNSDVKKLALINMRGQAVLEVENVPTERLQNGFKFNNIATGAYVVCLRTETNEVLTKKIIFN